MEDFGLPCRFEPLRTSTETTLLQRIGFQPRERALESRRSAQETLLVRDRAGFREMVASDADGELVWTRASLQDPSESGWPYVELFHVAAALAKQRTASTAFFRRLIAACSKRSGSASTVSHEGCTALE